MTNRTDIRDPAPTSLGYCPHCAVPVPTELLIIEYDRDHGNGRYAECPACNDVVRPAGSPTTVGGV